MVETTIALASMRIPPVAWNRSARQWVYINNRRQDLGEFEDVAQVHQKELYHVDLRLTRNRAEAEDVVQDAVLRAFRAFHTFARATNCRAWLFTILRNVFLNRERRQGREVLDTESTLIEPPGDPLVEWPAVRDPEDEYLQTVLHGD